MLGAIRALGRTTLALLHYLGGVTLLTADALTATFVSPVRWRLVLGQVFELGYRSQPVVILTGAFTGAVFAAQTFFQFKNLGMESAVGALVAVSMCRELGPVLTGSQSSMARSTSSRSRKCSRHRSGPMADSALCR